MRIHTNGILLDDRFCDLFTEHGVKVGISIDGDRAANDRHRVYLDGRSSYDKVVTAIRNLLNERYRPLYAGLLCTIDVRNDPVSTYDALACLDPPTIDFLLPHATWDQPPLAAVDGQTPYGDWLAAMFDRWTADNRRIRVRVFDSVIATTLGGTSHTEALGLEPSAVVVVETDGAIEQADSLKVAYDGAPATGYDVHSHDFDTVAHHPGIIAR